MTNMPYRHVGSSGLTVSAVGLGCNQIGRKLDLDGTRAVVDAAIDEGMTLFDTADVYGSYPGASEELLGHAVEGRRDAVVIATKFGMSMQGTTLPGHEARGSRQYIRASVEGSLRRLGTDHIDLYQLHRPDPLTSVRPTSPGGKSWTPIGLPESAKPRVSSALRTNTACSSVASKQMWCRQRNTSVLV